MPSDHAYGDMHGLKRRNMKKKKRREKSHRYSHCWIVSSVSCLTKSKRGQRIEYRRWNSETGCSISSLASDSSQQSSPESFEVFTANYCRWSEILGTFWRHFISQISEESSKVGHTKRGVGGGGVEGGRIIFVSFSVRMLLSDIWSRSIFWVTVHASWVLMSAKQLPFTDGIKVTFVANFGFIR